MSYSHMYPAGTSQPDSKEEAKSMVFLDVDDSFVVGNLNDVIAAATKAFQAFIEFNLTKHIKTDENITDSIADNQYTMEQVKQAFKIFPESKEEVGDKSEAIRKRWEYVVDVLEGKETPRHHDNAVVNDIKEYLKNHPIMVDHDDDHIRKIPQAVKHAKELHWQYVHSIVLKKRTAIYPAYPDEDLRQNPGGVNTRESIARRGPVRTNKQIIQDAVDKHATFFASKTGFPHVIKPYFKEVVGLDDNYLDKIEIYASDGGLKDIMILQAMLKSNFRGFLNLANVAIARKASEAKVENAKMDAWKKENGYDLQQWIKNPWNEEDPHTKNIESLLREIIKTNANLKNAIAKFIILFDDSENQRKAAQDLGCGVVEASVKDNGACLRLLNKHIDEMAVMMRKEASASNQP